MNRHHIGQTASLLLPIPFLIGVGMMATAFWQSDADFVLGRVASVDAILMDRGPPHPTSGRPRYFPTFRSADGELLILERALVATELPPTDKLIRLRCSVNKPTNCKTPASPNLDPVFYGIAAAYSVLTAGFTLLLWRPFFRRLRSHAKPRTEA